MILRALVLGEPVNHDPFSFLPPPTFIQSKNYFIKNYSIYFIFAFQENQKCVFNASEEAKMQTFPPVSTMVVPTINTCVENKILAPTFLRHGAGSDNGKVKFVCSASTSFLLQVNKITQKRICKDSWFSYTHVTLDR